MASIEIPQHLTTAINTYATAWGMDQATAVERLLTLGLEASDTSPAPQDLTGRIRAAYSALAIESGDWVGLADLRTSLADIDRNQVDAELTRLLRNREIMVIPEENQKALTPADHAAAVLVGREHRHLIAIER
jgi:hypothetical protein